MGRWGSDGKYVGDVMGVDGGPAPKMPAQADSVAADVATLVADHNALLAKLRAAGLMEE